MGEMQGMRRRGGSLALDIYVSGDKSTSTVWSRHQQYS